MSGCVGVSCCGFRDRLWPKYLAFGLRAKPINTERFFIKEGYICFIQRYREIFYTVLQTDILYRDTSR